MAPERLGIIVAESWTSDLAGAQAADVSVYQSVIDAVYTSTQIVDTDGEERDLGAPKVCSARLTVTTLTGTTPLLDVKLQHRAKPTDSWADVTDGAFTQANAAAEESIAVIHHRYIRVVSNFTNTITAASYNVALTVNN